MTNKELTEVNMNLSNDFSSLHLFASVVLGKETLMKMLDNRDSYDIDQMIDRYQKIQEEMQSLKDSNQQLISSLSKIVSVGEKYQNLLKKIEGWGGEQAILESFKKTLELQKEIENKNEIIENLNDKIGSLSEGKGGELLEIMNNVNENGDERMKMHYQKEISKKEQDILELKEKIRELQEECNSYSSSLSSLRRSRDEFTEIGEVQSIHRERKSENRLEKSIDGGQMGLEECSGRSEIEELKISERILTSHTKKQEERKLFDELEEMEKLYELEKEKVKILEEEIQKINENYENSKAKYVKLLVDKDKDIERILKSKNSDAKIPEEISPPQSSKSLTQSTNKLPSYDSNMITDSFSSDYLRNTFGKYLIYMASKKEKRAKTCENILFTLLNITEEQINQINKARKKNSFWDFFK